MNCVSVFPWYCCTRLTTLRRIRLRSGLRLVAVQNRAQTRYLLTLGLVPSLLGHATFPKEIKINKNQAISRYVKEMAVTIPVSRYVKQEVAVTIPVSRYVK